MNFKPTLMGFLFFSSLSPNWAEKTLKKMSCEEKICQLFMVAVHPDTQNSLERATKTISDYHVGGIIFFEGDPEKQVTFVNQLQKTSKLPLLVGQDCEWGLAHRLRNTIAFPKNMTLGAIQNNTYIYELGKEIGRQCLRIGVHINFAPVIDVNTNSHNPVIGMRSFGAHKELVTQKAQLFLAGMTESGVLGCAKHFPGHGDTSADSHYQLPTIDHSLERLLNEELFPFDHMIKTGIPAIMVGHLHIPILDSTPNIPATLSRLIVHDLLRKTLNFNGLIISDSLVMHAITKHWPGGQAEYMALRAGNDILLCPRNIPQAITRITQALDSGEITQEELDTHVLRILKAKQALKLHKNRFVQDKNIMCELNTPYAQELRTQLYRAAFTHISDPLQNIPLKTKHIVTMQVGGAQQTCSQIYVPEDPSNQESHDVCNKIKFYDACVIGICTKTVSEQTQKLLSALRQTGKKNIFALLTSPYNVAHVAPNDTVLIGYENTPETWAATLDVAIGNTRATGILPI